MIVLVLLRWPLCISSATTSHFTEMVALVLLMWLNMTSGTDFPPFSKNKHIDLLYPENSKNSDMYGCYLDESNAHGEPIWMHCMHICGCSEGRENWASDKFMVNLCDPGGELIKVACDYGKCRNEPNCRTEALTTFLLESQRTEIRELTSYINFLNIEISNLRKELNDTRALAVDRKYDFYITLTTSLMGFLTSVVAAALTCFTVWYKFGRDRRVPSTRYRPAPAKPATTVPSQTTITTKSATAV